MSSLYLSEVHSINLVKMDSGSKDTADRHEAEDRRPDGLADWGGAWNTVHKVDTKQRKRGASIYCAEYRGGGECMNVMKRNSQRGRSQRK